MTLDILRGSRGKVTMPIGGHLCTSTIRLLFRKALDSLSKWPRSERCQISLLDDIYKHFLIAALAALTFSFRSASFARVEQKYLSKGPIFIKNVTVIDGKGNKPVAGQDIFMKDGKITAITATGTNSAPKGIRLIDGSGLTAMPGLIDMHYHLKGGWSGGNVLQ